MLLNHGQAGFDPAVAYPVSASSPHALAAADLNFDGVPELAVVHGGGDILSLLVNRGDGTFLKWVPYGVGYGPLSVTFADLNGDRSVDIAAAAFSSVASDASMSGIVSVLLNSCQL